MPSSYPKLMAFIIAQEGSNATSAPILISGTEYMGHTGALMASPHLSALKRHQGSEPFLYPALWKG